MNKMITIRMNERLHAAVKELAYQERKSMNQLVVEMLTGAVGYESHARALLQGKGKPRG